MLDNDYPAVQSNTAGERLQEERRAKVPRNGPIAGEGADSLSDFFKSEIGPLDRSLRFTVGTNVICRLDSGFGLGTVVALNHREEDWPEGKSAPYQVQLRDGPLIWVPYDVPESCFEYVKPKWFKAVLEEDVQKLADAISLGCEEVHTLLDQTPLLACVTKGWQEGALFLLGQRADPCKSVGAGKRTALHFASVPLRRVVFQDSDMDRVTFLRTDGVVIATMEKAGSTGDDMHDHDHGEIVSTFFYDDHAGKLSWAEEGDEAEGNEEERSFSILPEALRHWVPSRLSTLIRGTTVKSEGLPPARNCTPLVRALLNARADVNAQNEDAASDMDKFTSTTDTAIEQREHRSALHYAAQNGEVEICAHLIEARAEVDLEDRFKLTPLDLALEVGSMSVVDLLLTSAADPHRGNVRRGLQQTPLHQASDVGNVELAQLLLKHGCNANLAGEQGMTPLHLAARKKHIDVVQVLLESGAEVDLSDTFGFTPAQYAVSSRVHPTLDLGKALEIVDHMQLCDRIAILENAKADRSCLQKELAERQTLPK